MRVTKCLLTLLSCSWLLVQATKSCDDKSSCQMTRDLLTETEEELSQCNTRLAQLTGDDSSSYISQLTSWISSQSTKGSPAAQAIAFRTLISKLLKTLELDIDPAKLAETTHVDLSIVLTKTEVVRLQRHLLADEGTQAELLGILANSIQANIGFIFQMVISTRFSALLKNPTKTRLISQCARTQYINL